MIKGIFAAFLLLCGVVNLKSEAAGSLGWVLIIVGCALLIYQLSGPSKRSKNAGGGTSYSDAGDSGDSDFSGGDGGGGGGD
jgi:hypothetical protein